MTSIWLQAEAFLFAAASRLVLESTEFPNQLVLKALSLGVKQLGHEMSNWPPSSTQVKIVQRYTSTPPYIIML
jgi:hypothetical protein